MALYPDYVTVTQLKTHLRITDTADDVELGIAITAASRAIDKACNRQFGNGMDTRYYRYTGVVVDDLPAVAVFDLADNTGLQVTIDQGGDGTHDVVLVEGTDFDLWPYSAQGDGKPYTHIVFRRGAQAYPCGFAREVQVASSSIGWQSVPVVVEQACLIQAARFFVRRDSQYGVAGSPEAGNELRLLDRLDPDVAVALTAVRRHWGAIGG